jgi:predicted transcriptional regulator
MWQPSKLTHEQIEERRMEGGRLLREGNLSHAEIARRLGVSCSAVSQWAQQIKQRRRGVKSLKRIKGRRDATPSGHRSGAQSALPVSRDKDRTERADAIATVRLCLWGDYHFSTSGNNSDVVKVPRSLLERLTDAVCYAAWMDKVELSFSQATLENNFGATCGSLSVVLQAEGFDEQSESLE